MSRVASLLPARLAVFVVVLAVSLLPLVAQDVGDINPCFQSCHDEAMELYNVGGDDWYDLAAHVFDACMEENCSA